MSTPTRAVIAEDEAIIRLDLKEMLEEEGLEVVGEAADGESAVRLTRELVPDLVIMDVKMPVLDGLAAAERIAQEDLAAVVVLTAFSQRDLVARASRAGALAYVVKPFQKSDLLPAIEIALARRADISGLRAESSKLSDRLETRVLLDKAKGRLMDTQAMSEAEAFRWLQKKAMDERRPVRDVAHELLEADH
jgi:AmiR/NasT family two-component response regulator